MQRDLLAVLTGRSPGEPPAATFELSALGVPKNLPVSLPSALVRQRPDVLAAEGQLHAPVPRSVSRSPICCRRSI